MVTQRLASRVHAFLGTIQHSRQETAAVNTLARICIGASSRHVKHFRRLAKPDREVKLIQIGAARRILLDLYSRVPPCVFPRFSGFRNSEVRLCSVISETPRMTPLHESSLCTVSELLVPMSSIACCWFSRVGALRSHLPASMFRARIDGPDSEPTDTLDHTNVVWSNALMARL